MDAEAARAQNLAYRRKYRGVIGVASKMPIKDSGVLSLIYTPGVAEPCLEIAADPQLSFEYTCRGNTIALVSDGSAGLSLGNAGPLPAMPLLEDESVMFRTFAGVNALPIGLATQEPDKIVQVVKDLAPTFGAVCLEAIDAPQAFEVLERLQEEDMPIPVLQNRQQMTPVIVWAALQNALKLTGKRLDRIRIVIVGAGPAGMGCADLLLAAGARRIIVCDRHGALVPGRAGQDSWREKLAGRTNPERVTGSLAEVLAGADVLIGVSVSGIVSPEMVTTMAKGAIVLTLALPDPEINPVAARIAGAKIVATARADYPNEINSALVYPGVFRGLLAVRARRFTPAMALAAAEALAELVEPDQLSAEYIIPRVLDFRVGPAIATAVAAVAHAEGLAQVPVDPQRIAANTRRFIYERDNRVLPKIPHRAAMTLREDALDLHRRYQGKLDVKVHIPIVDRTILDMLYMPPNSLTPAVAIARDPNQAYELIAKSNLVAIVSDGSAVLGLGNIGPEAALPVMEGKSILFNTFGGVEAFPICVATQDVDEIVDLVCALEPTFGGINLEDISAPRCFAIEERLQHLTDIPVFHDDQHGTAVVVLAGLINALKLVNKEMAQIRVVMNGAGAAGIACTRLLMAVGVSDVILCDRAGAIYEGRPDDMNWLKEEMARVTNRAGVRGSLADALRGADVFIGVSAPGVLTLEMIYSMARKPIIFALANPTPEIMPDLARAAGAAVVATGRSDFNNQVNNSLAFPGIFRGALDARVRNITDPMKIAAAHAIAAMVSERALSPDFIIPYALDYRVSPNVAAAVARCAVETGEARVPVDPAAVAENLMNFIYEGYLGPLEATGVEALA